MMESGGLKELPYLSFSDLFSLLSSKSISFHRMNKSLQNVVLFFGLATALFLSNFFGFKLTVADSVGFSIFSVCLFHLIASSLAFGIFEAAIKFIPSQAGVAFLALVFVKLGVFTMVFSSNILGEVSLNKPEKFTLIIPMFSFLLLEGVWIARSLKIFDKEIAQSAVEAYPKESEENDENDKN